jgi:predicted nucleotidyltransferase
MNSGLQPQDIAVITQALRLFPEVEEVILFGSRAKGNFKPGSDVDIAVKGEKVTHTTIIQLSSYLNEETVLPYFFDVIQIEKITNKALLEHVNRVGKNIYTR